MAVSPAPHTSVLLAEVLQALQPRDGGIYVDGTFGVGGYSRAMLDAAECSVFGIDRDPEAVRRGTDMAKHYDGRFAIIEGCFGDMDTLLAQRNITQVDGVALDLGVSSPQLDEAERGFSFRTDGPLDMRMGADGESAADVVNTLDAEPLANIIYQYGEERLSRRIARAIVEARAVEPIARTKQLAEIVRRVVPKSRDGIDPATRTFQALRIYVNDELGEVDRGLVGAERLLAPGGRLAVVSFHSLEDRRVKLFLQMRSGQAPKQSRHHPEGARGVEPEQAPSFRLLKRGVIKPEASEVRDNPRARSARLRVAERTHGPIWCNDRSAA